MRRRLTKQAHAETVTRRPWRERLSLGAVITWTAAAAILAASLIAGYYALTVLYQNKLADTWAIMFLELEHEGSVLADRLAANSAGMEPVSGMNGGGSPDDAVLGLGAEGKLHVVSGSFGGDPLLADFNLEGQKLPHDLPPLAVLTYAGVPYLARTLEDTASGSTAQLALRKVPSQIFALKPGRPADQGRLFVLTREGRLLYTSDPAITETTVVGRALVQFFIKAPVKQGQMELAGDGGEPFYGFFAEIPKTNVVMFSEVSKAATMAPVRLVVGRFLLVLAGILATAVVLLQYPLGRITSPVRDLAQLALSVGQGRFDVSPKAHGFGELSILTTAFSSMAAGLVERDRKVAALMREQADKARLAGELAIARRIQENLLPAKPLPKDAGLLVSAEYISAAECAGDWYHYAYDPARQETVVVIADVSGHGAGSSMFTAIIAGLFDEYRSRDEARFDLQAFVKKTNDVIYRLGRGQWHATMMIARHIAGEDKLDVLVAGHPQPLLRASDAGEASPVARLPSASVLGLDLAFEVSVGSIPFAAGTTLLVYTDGLTEATNAAGKAFGRKRARDLFLKGESDPRQATGRIVDGWRTYLAGSPAADDVCVIVMRAA